MRRTAGLLCGLVVMGVGLAGQGQPAGSAAPPAKRRRASPAPARRPRGLRTPRRPRGLSAADQTQMVKEYCATCHSERGKAGGLSLTGFDAAAVVDQAPVVEKMIRKLRAGMMPPAGARRPEPAAIAALASAFETRIDQHAALNPNPGSRPSQRLNRAEYQRAVRDLLGIEVDVTAFLPADTISDGFDNVADVAGDLDRVDGGLPARREPDQPSGRWATRMRRRAPPPGRCRARSRRCATSRAPRSAPAAACR